MNFLSKLSLIILGLSIYIAYEYNSVEVPSFIGYNQLNEINFKFREISKIAISKLINYADKLNFTKEHEFYRHYVHQKLKTYPDESFYENIKINITKINNVNVTIYSSILSKKANNPLLIYFHGGGFALCSSELYEPYLIELIKQLPDLIVISVDYRLAPEHPFPTPTDDCNSVTNYIINNSEEFNADKKSIILAGDSAGIVL